MDEQGYCANYIETEQVRGFYFHRPIYSSRFHAVYLPILHIIPCMLIPASVSHSGLDTCYLIKFYIMKNSGICLERSEYTMTAFRATCDKRILVNRCFS